MSVVSSVATKDTSELEILTPERKVPKRRLGFASGRELAGPCLCRIDPFPCEDS